MIQNNSHRDLDLVSLHFPTDYVEDAEGALAALQLLLLDESLIEARAAFLESLAASAKASLAPAQDFANEIALICDTGLIDYHRAGKFTPDLVQRMHELSCDPAAMRRANRLLAESLAALECTTDAEDVKSASVVGSGEILPQTSPAPSSIRMHGTVGNQPSACDFEAQYTMALGGSAPSVEVGTISLVPGYSPAHLAEKLPWAEPEIRVTKQPNSDDGTEVLYSVGIAVREDARLARGVVHVVLQAPSGQPVQVDLGKNRPWDVFPNPLPADHTKLRFQIVVEDTHVGADSPSGRTC